MYYLFIDCETGGLSEWASLLTLGVIITDNTFNILEEIEWEIKPDDGDYVVTAQGLSINKINLIEHEKTADTYSNTGTKLYKYLYKWYTKSKAVGGHQLIPVGKNVQFDCERIFRHLLHKETWEQFCSYQPLEINGAWRLLEAQGKVPVLPKTSLNNLCNHFNIEVKDLHNSLGDCHLYVELLKKVVQL